MRPRLLPPPPCPPAGATLLKAADNRIEGALSSASKVYTDNSAYLQAQLARQAEFHKANLESYKQAREAYLKKVRHAAAATPLQPQSGSRLARATSPASAACLLPPDSCDAYDWPFPSLCLQVEDAVEFVKQKGLTGAARAAADEVLVRVGEAKNAVLGAPAFLLHKVRCGCFAGRGDSVRACGGQDGTCCALLGC